MTQFGEAAAKLAGAAAMLLGWRPADFWDSTPAELAAALQLPGDAEGPDQDKLAELMRRFPDKRENA